MLKGLIKDILATNQASTASCWRLPAYAADVPYPGKTIM